MSTSAQQRSEALSALVRQAGEAVSVSTLLPASDYFDLAGEEFGRRLLLTEGADGTQYCLRPDFTLPIAKAYISQSKSIPAAFAYLGRVFRQRDTGPAEFEQAGLELLAQADADDALYKVIDFSRDALAIFEVASPEILLGSVALFEKLLVQVDMPNVWKPRLRRRFGNKSAMEALLKRLADPHVSPNTPQKSRYQLIEQIEQKMREDGLSLNEGRKPSDIADRYLEKQALAAAIVPAKTIALLEQYFQISGGVGKAIEQVQNLLQDNSILLENPIKVLQTHAKNIQQRFPSSNIKFDASFSPRLHYYTGLVFELRNSKDKILVSGGQYDRLLQALGAPNEIAASGCAIWVNRLQEEGA